MNYPSIADCRAKKILRGVSGLLFLLGAVLVFAVFTPAAHAQGFGGIHGTVTDPSGAVVVGANVAATQMDTGRTTTVTTNGDGYFVFPKLLPASYTLAVKSPGFENYLQRGVVLQADQQLTDDVKLAIGAEDHVVDVMGNAEQVNTTNGTLSQVVDEQRVVDLPLNGRNAAQLTTLVAGAVVGPTDGSDQGVTKSFPAVVNVSINGSRVYQTNYMLNGGNNVDEYTNVNGPFPFPDALQEFSVQTSNYSAQYGQNAGGVVNIITKSGGDKYHGVLFEYVRNRVFNAASYFGYQNGVKTTDPLKRNQFGGTFSGPLAIPHVFKAKDTFFFFGYQRTAIRTATNGNSAFVPTDAERNGDFSALLTVNPNNPIGKAEQLHTPTPNATSSPAVNYADNYIDPSTFDPAAALFINDLPHATGNGKVLYALPTSQTFDEFFSRVDFNLGQKDQLFAHFYSNHFFNAGISNTSNLLTYTDQSDIWYRSSLIAETHTFTSNLVSNFLVNYLQEVSSRGPAPGAPSVTDFGVNIWQPTQRAIQRIKPTGYFSIGANPFAAFQRNNYTLSEDIHWVLGNHNISFGVHAEISKADIGSLYQQPGLFTFSNKSTGDALAGLMLGSMSSFVQGSGQYYDGRNHFFGFYAEDSWKASRRFSLVYGLRYEPYYPWKEVEGRTEQFNQAAYTAGTTSKVFTQAPPGLLFPGDPGVPAQGFNAIYTHFMPRLGFSYDVFGNGKTAIRGGAGIFYDTRIQAAYNANAGEVTPFSISLTLTNPGCNSTNPGGPFSDPYKTGCHEASPFPGPFSLSANSPFPTPVQAYTFDNDGNFKPPVTYEWNLALEQQFTENLLGRVAYVGSQSAHNAAFLEWNPTRNIGTGGDGPRLRPVFSNITDSNSGANDSYHSLQLSLQQRVTRGLTVLANYTWSKSLDDLVYNPGSSLSYVYPVFTQADQTNPNSPIIFNPDFRKLDRGPSDFDRRNVFSGSYVWKFPTLNAGPSALRYLVNHWETTGIVQIQSGDSLTVVSSADTSNTAIGQDRATYKGGNPYKKGLCTPGPCAYWLNNAAFSVPPTATVAQVQAGNVAATFGNVQKGEFAGPGYADWDAGIYRSFPIRASAQLQFRAEYFDVLNHTNFGDPNTDVNGAGFGEILSLNAGNPNPRLAQMSLKLMF